MSLLSSPNVSEVFVHLGERSYRIWIGVDILRQLGSVVAGLGRVTLAVVIADANVVTPHAETACDSLREAGVAAELVVVPPGETTKSVETATTLWRELLRRRADRKTFVVAVGGGMVGDLAGFVAATYARGVPFFQVPTSLLAQVDSSVGGKVAVNLPEAKNMVGAFYQPRGVLIDVATLDTLPDREYRSGLAEVVKYGVILDEEFFAFLEKHCDALRIRDQKVLPSVVQRCCRLKADVVEKDEREETGLRAILNYGHTFGHAIESLTGYEEWLHGEAVAVGMICAAKLAERLGLAPPGLADRQQSLLGTLGLPTRLPRVDIPSLLRLMQHDKKAVHGKLRFILPRRIGQVEVVDNVSTDSVVQVLEEVME
ncbi:MAG: 3-dehydroquinate synthase [Thermoguttaceae bacterium]|nr:3-dehydroquinate synthase [Thermoguttaceae bacterium]MDW8078800.1 3-dehydroquinate synthase [Thermoguttaceae bacterium]